MTAALSTAFVLGCVTGWFAFLGAIVCVRTWRGGGSS